MRSCWDWLYILYSLAQNSFVPSAKPVCAIVSLSVERKGSFSRSQATKMCSWCTDWDNDSNYGYSKWWCIINWKTCHWDNMHNGRSDDEVSFISQKSRDVWDGCDPGMTFRKMKCIWWSPGKWWSALGKQGSTSKLESVCKASLTGVTPNRFEFSVLDFSALAKWIRRTCRKTFMKRKSWQQTKWRKETLGINEKEIVGSRGSLKSVYVLSAIPSVGALPKGRAEGKTEG